MPFFKNSLYYRHGSTINPFWDSKPELFSDIACLRITYQPCIVLFRNFFSGTPASGVFKSRHILLHKYVNRIMITYLWRQIQLIIPSRRFRSIAILKVCHVIAFSITWYSLFHTSDLSVLKHSFLFTRGTSFVNI
jgi:hypothetical protein